MPGRKQYAFGSALEDKDRNQSRTCAKNDKGRSCYRCQSAIEGQLAVMSRRRCIGTSLPMGIVLL